MKILYAIIVFMIISVYSTYSVTSLEVKNGFIEISKSDLSIHPIPLRGEWAFYSSQFILPNIYDELDNIPNATDYHRLPAVWNNFEINNKKIGAESYGTYSITVKLDHIPDILGLKVNDIGSSCRIYIDDNLLVQNGQIGTDELSSIPYWKPDIYFFKPGSPTFTITVQVSNYHFFSGGMWSDIYIGTQQTIKAKKTGQTLLDFLIFGSIIVMSIYHFALYLMRRKDISSLYFGVFSFLISMRVLISGEMYILDLIPNLKWQTVMVIAYLTVALPSPVFLAFLDSLYPDRYSKKVLASSSIIALVFSIIIILTPVRFFSEIAYIFQIFVLLVSIYCIYLIVRSVINKEKTAFIVLIGLIVLFLTIINDVLHTQNIIRTAFITPYGLFVFIFSQSIILSYKFAMAYKQIEDQRSDLINTNEAYSRFVPKEFLFYLKKSSITEIRLGDCTTEDMSILFSDIRNFTTLAESMNQKDTFDFLNSYLSRIGPIVRNNNGFIDKYIGDAIMALFPGSPSVVVKAAVEMQREMIRYNIDRQRAGYRPISIGIGINSGPMMLGTIGEHNRMDSTVISDIVNLASRLESLTKLYGASILTTADILADLTVLRTYNYRMIDVVTVKGRFEPATLIEILDGLPDEQFELKLQSKFKYEEGLQCYQFRDMVKAREIFSELHRINPEDKAVKLFLDRSSIFSELPDDWDWISRYEEK